MCTKQGYKEFCKKVPSLAELKTSQQSAVAHPWQEPERSLRRLERSVKEPVSINFPTKADHLLVNILQHSSTKNKIVRLSNALSIHKHKGTRVVAAEQQSHEGHAASKVYLHSSHKR